MLRFGSIGITSVLLILVLLGGTIYFVNNHQGSNQPGSVNSAGRAQTATTLTKPTPASTLAVTPTPQRGLYIAGTYKGTMFNETTQQSTSITVFIVQSNGYAPLSGSVTFQSPPQGVYLLHGNVDTHGNFSFSMQQPAGQTPLLFYGAIQGSYLHGNYCSSSTNMCLANTGYFNAGPRY